MDVSWMNDAGDFKEAFLDYMEEQQENADDMAEEKLIQTLPFYMLLYEVPFVYLIPNAAMLQADEIRFFYLDNNWVKCLIDGMLSLGRNSESDQLHDQHLIGKAFRHSRDKLPNVRLDLQGKDLVEDSLGMKTVCSGFMMRSNLVRGWRGLEFHAYGKSKGVLNEDNPLTALRIETLAEDVLIGIYKGEIAALDINEPPEGLFYGFTTQNKFHLRDFADGKNIQQIETAVTNNRVVDMTGLASQIGRAANLPEDKISSAHIALQLLRTAKRIRFMEK